MAYKKKKGKANGEIGHRRKKLSIKERSFVEYMAIGDCTQTECARRAGYKIKYAATLASQLMKKPHITERIEEQKAIANSKERAIIGDVYNYLKDNAFKVLKEMETTIFNLDAPEAVRLKAMTDWLDRSGYKPTDRIEIESPHKDLADMDSKDLFRDIWMTMGHKSDEVIPESIRVRMHRAAPLTPAEVEEKTKQRETEKAGREIAKQFKALAKILEEKEKNGFIDGAERDRESDQGTDGPVSESEAGADQQAVGRDQV